MTEQFLWFTYPDAKPGSKWTDPAWRAGDNYQEGSG